MNEHILIIFLVIIVIPEKDAAITFCISDWNEGVILRV